MKKSGMSERGTRVGNLFRKKHGFLCEQGVSYLHLFKKISVPENRSHKFYKVKKKEGSNFNLRNESLETQRAETERLHSRKFLFDENDSEVEYPSYTPSLPQIGLDISFTKQLLHRLETVQEVSRHHEDSHTQSQADKFKSSDANLLSDPLHTLCTDMGNQPLENELPDRIPLPLDEKTYFFAPNYQTVKCVTMSHKPHLNVTVTLDFIDSHRTARSLSVPSKTIPRSLTKGLKITVPLRPCEQKENLQKRIATGTSNLSRASAISMISTIPRTSSTSAAVTARKQRTKSSKRNKGLEMSLSQLSNFNSLVSGLRSL